MRDIRSTGNRETCPRTPLTRRISDWFNTVATPPDPRVRLLVPELRDYPTRVRR
ncbi:MAG TPA: hypothetical protein VGJ53_07900 [Micromonosporaceae bacterium]|jgi:hypothetical protein